MMQQRLYDFAFQRLSLRTVFGHLNFKKGVTVHGFIPGLKTLDFATHLSVYSRYPGCVGNSICF